MNQIGLETVKVLHRLEAEPVATSRYGTAADLHTAPLGPIFLKVMVGAAYDQDFQAGVNVSLREAGNRKEQPPS